MNLQGNVNDLLRSSTLIKGLSKVSENTAAIKKSVTPPGGIEAPEKLKQNYIATQVPTATSAYSQLGAQLGAEHQGQGSTIPKNITHWDNLRADLAKKIGAKQIDAANMQSKDFVKLIKNLIDKQHVAAKKLYYSKENK